MSKGVKPPKVIAVLSSKGGVGKSTIATHVAGALHLKGARVLVLDLDDEQGSAAAWAASRGPDSRLAGLPVLLQGRPLTPERYAKVLHQAQQAGGPIQYVILDGPPRLSEQAKAAARLADLVVIPVRADQYAVWALDKTWTLLDEQDECRDWPVRRLLVLTQAKRRARLTEAATAALRQAEARRQVERELGGALPPRQQMVEAIERRLVELLQAMPGPVVLHESVQYGVATMQGETVASVASSSAAAELVRELEYLVGRITRALAIDRAELGAGAVQHG